jgi:hypothetical protein
MPPSYSPLPIATPISIHAANIDTGPCDIPSATSPRANSALVAISIGRPPWRSMARPEAGPTSAEMTSATEKAANTVGIAKPRSRAIGAASMAGR